MTGSSASWRGRVALAEADGKPGHYYVSIIDRHGRTCLALGPFTQLKPGQTAHAQALGLTRKVRHHVRNYTEAAWWRYGTCRLDLCSKPPRGKLNDACAP